MPPYSTGRLSSSNPNLQNIPIRTSEGRLIRTAFEPKDGFKLVSMDYSQIELRLIAHIADETKMLEAFNNDIDIHTDTASKVFGIRIDQVNSDHRRKNFLRRSNLRLLSCITIKELVVGKTKR